MAIEDLVGAARANSFSPSNPRLIRSNAQYFQFSNTQPFAHLWGSGTEARPVVNETHATGAKSIKPLRPLFLYNNGIWVEGQNIKEQRIFVKDYYKQTFSQFNLNSAGVGIEPLIYSFQDISDDARWNELRQRGRTEGFSSISVFDLAYEPSSNVNLADYDMGGNRRLQSFISEILGQEPNNHIVVGFFSKKYHGLNLESTQHHVHQFWSMEKRVNFIFPTSPYSEKTLFSYEFGTLSEVLLGLCTNFENCSEVLATAQHEVARRYSEKNDAVNNEQASICASSFLYYKGSNLNKSQSESLSTNLSKSIQVARFPKVPSLDELSMNHPTGFSVAECIQVEQIAQRMCNKSLNFLNELGKTDGFLNQAFLFSIALSIFDLFASRTDPLSQDEVHELFQVAMDAGDPLFPRSLFRHFDSPRETPPPCAYSRIYSHFAQTTHWIVRPPISTERTLVYARILLDDPEFDYRAAKATFTEIFASLRKATNHSEAKSALGIDPVNIQSTPFGLFLLDQQFTQIMKKMIPEFHVIHRDELRDLNIGGHFPDVDLWIGSTSSIFVHAEKVNSKLSKLRTWFEGMLAHPLPFGNLNRQIKPKFLDARWVDENLKKFRGGS